MYDRRILRQGRVYRQSSIREKTKGKEMNLSVLKLKCLNSQWFLFCLTTLHFILHSKIINSWILAIHSSRSLDWYLFEPNTLDFFQRNHHESWLLLPTMTKSYFSWRFPQETLKYSNRNLQFWQLSTHPNSFHLSNILKPPFLSSLFFILRLKLFFIRLCI